MAWTQEEIRAEHDRLTERLNDAYREMEIIRAEMRVLHTRCDHPRAFTYSAMGELGRKCPDCGWAT